MKISLNWLREYIGLTQSVREIEDALTMIGFEVEGVEHTGIPHLDNVVVGQILSREQHPNADRLTVCEVRVSELKDPVTIVCGAKNHKVGDHVPTALVGAVLPGNFKIKESKLRGVPSFGMMCSPKELGLGGDHNGLMILDGNPPVGAAINDVLDEGDTIFDVEVTPNRPDCLSHVGMARELSAYFGMDMTYPETRTAPAGPFADAPESLLKGGVVVNDPELCPYYTAYSIRGVTVKPSPDWLRKALEGIGVRSVNNVVDVTNYVLMELGNPLHAFDAKKIKGEQLIVRTAKEGEKITTLDEKERVLDKDMLVIADKERALAVAGVMGSMDAQVDESTTDIVLEAAYFTPAPIRRTSKALALTSDSAYRFERGVDLQGVNYAATRAIDLILDVAGGTLCGGASLVGHREEIEHEIEITPAEIRRVCGFGPDNKKIEAIFESLELDVSVHEDIGDGERWVVRIPSHRSDLERPADLIEEFLRIYGTNKIPATDVASVAVEREDDGTDQYEKKVSRFLVGQFFNECVNYSFRSREETEKVYGKSVAARLELANPLASDQSHLRPSLVPGLLDVLKHNQHHNTGPVRLFETGRTFRDGDQGVAERLSAGFLWVDSPREQTWKAPEGVDFYTIKHLVLECLRLGGIAAEGLSFEPITENPIWQAGHSAKCVCRKGRFEVSLGLVAFPILKEWDVEGVVWGASVHWDPKFLNKASKVHQFEPVSAFPSSSRDLALLVDESESAQTVQDAVIAGAKELLDKDFGLERIHLFDLYQGEGLAEGKKSLAFSLTFRSPERTLKDKEVGAVFDGIQKYIKDHTSYQIRN